MDIKQYLDSTYLKTAEQAGISEQENEKLVTATVQEAIDEQFKLIMIRPQFVKLAKQMITEQKSEVLVGTVIGFHEGTTTIDEKLHEAEQAVRDGVDELDYVVNYQAFKEGIIDLVKNEVLLGTKFGLKAW
jgi:deoxyribose-phosphate aldolase